MNRGIMVRIHPNLLKIIDEERRRTGHNRVRATEYLSKELIRKKVRIRNCDYGGGLF